MPISCEVCSLSVYIVLLVQCCALRVGHFPIWRLKLWGLFFPGLPSWSILALLFLLFSMLFSCCWLASSQKHHFGVLIIILESGQCSIHVKKTHTTLYHPQGNGQRERFNCMLRDLLRTLSAEKKKKKWPQHLQDVVQAYLQQHATRFNWLCAT